MCGLAGFVDLGARLPADALAAGALRMADTLRRRGPDDGGVWVDESAGVALAFRRLAIIDLSADGHQPMASSCGRYVIIFNGEIYNFRDLRRELEAAGERFRSRSDTEVLLAAIGRWGVEASLARTIGMFAFALWDREARRLTLARDRLGKKPLYVGVAGGSLVFGSELKALRAHPGFDATIDRGALSLFLRHGYVPAPYSIYQSVGKLRPGTILALDLGRLRPLPSPAALMATAVPYWSARAVVDRASAAPFAGSDVAAIEELDALLTDAVGRRMVADVPLGAFLSGGIDSSTVVALMQKQADRPVKTFSIGFAEAGFDEAVHAGAVARHLGTDHTELYVTPEEARQVVPLLPEIYDEPFADSSQIPTYLVSELARRSVTVSLSGDGGDELFGGYRRYFQAARLWSALRALPVPARRMAAAAARGVAVQPLAAYRGSNALIAGLQSRLLIASDRVAKVSEVIGAADVDELYRRLVSHWKGPAEVVREGREPPTALTDDSSLGIAGGEVHRMMYLDLVTYLPDDILTKVDRASMAVGLEARTPLLDHRVVEFAWRLPVAMKIRHGQGKWPLRQVLDRYVPRPLVDRPKMGFGVPLGAWLSGPLKPWAEDLLDERRLAAEGYFDPAPIREKWREHRTGLRNWQYPLWNVLTFQAWLAATHGQAGAASPAVPTRP